MVLENAVPLIDKINQISVDLGFSKYTENTSNTLDLFCITAALMVGTAGLPHVIVRFFTVKNVKAVRKSAYWTLSFIAIIYLTAPALGCLPVPISSRKLTKKIQEAPEWFKNWEEQGMIAWVDKNNDGIMQYRAGDVFRGKPTYDDSTRQDGSPANCHQSNSLASENEVYYDKDIIVLANPEMAGLPQWVIALVMAGCVAAALSTAAGYSWCSPLPYPMI
jgi:cation/acetate symporter